MVLVPVPAILRRVPALTKTGAPEFRLNEAPSPCRSKVAPNALLNTAAPLQGTFPFVHEPAPALSKVPPWSVLLPAPVMVMAPFAATVNPDPALPKEPVIQLNNPAT